MRECETTTESTGQRRNRHALPRERILADHGGGAGTAHPREGGDNNRGTEANDAGFYAGSLDPDRRRRFTEALKEEGLDREIALIRVVIYENLGSPDLLQKWVDLLIKGVKAQHTLSKVSEDGLSQKLIEVLEGFGLQLLPEEAKDSPTSQGATETAKVPAADCADEHEKGHDQDGGGS